MTRLDLWLTALLVSIGTPAAPPVMAQQADQPSRPTRVPVTVALIDAPTDAPFRVLRRVSVAPRDVILLRRGGNADDLSGAVHQLLLIRRLQGDTAQNSGVMRLNRPRESRHEVRRYPWATRVLDDLQSAPHRLVAGVGIVPAVEIWLPPQHGRAPTR